MTSCFAMGRSTHRLPAGWPIFPSSARCPKYPPRLSFAGAISNFVSMTGYIHSEATSSPNLTGDPDQIDNPYVDAASNGLTYVVERFKNEPLAGHITLSKGERSILAERAAEFIELAESAIILRWWAHQGSNLGPDD